MTIIDKLQAGVELSPSELQQLATGYSLDCGTDSGEYKEIDIVELDSGRWMKRMQTIIQVGDDLWCIPWEGGLTECRPNEFSEKPFKVVQKKRFVTETYYE